MANLMMHNDGFRTSELNKTEKGAVRLLRRGAFTIDVEDSAPGTKVVTKEGFLGIRRKVMITLGEESALIGFEGDILFDLRGPRVKRCFNKLPVGFTASHGMRHHDPEIQREINRRARVTMAALNFLASGLERNPELYDTYNLSMK